MFQKNTLHSDINDNYSNNNGDIIDSIDINGNGDSNGNVISDGGCDYSENGDAIATDVGMALIVAKVAVAMKISCYNCLF